MFARISTYRTGPETVSAAPSQEIVDRVLQVPGNKGIYFLSGNGIDKAISITLWESEEAMVESRQEANKIRKESSEAERTQIMEVEEFEVTLSSLKD